MNVIQSRTHHTVKNIISLRQTKERRVQGLFIAEGIRVISSLLDSHIKLHQLYCLENNQSLLWDLKTLCNKHNYNSETSITLISQSVLEKITTLTTSSGVVALFYIPTPKPLTELSHGIVLADIQSPGNMGTIIRTAAALNVPSVVIIEGTDVWSPKVVQATAGTIGMVNLFECRWNELLAAKKELQLCALVVAGGESPHAVNPNNTLFVVGNEAHGLPDAWTTDCDKKITLPMPGNTESLNAALALSIVMYITHFYCKN